MRIYDAGEEYGDCIDRYSLVLPFPERIAKRTGVQALGIGFNQGTGQTIVADSFELSPSSGISEKGLGERISIEVFDRTTRDWCLHVADLWRMWCHDQSDMTWLKLRRVLGK